MRFVEGQKSKLGGTVMKFYEIHDPYYSLIKAKDEDEAIRKYVENVANDDEGCNLKDEISEVERDYALAQFSRTGGESGETIPVHEILKDFQSDDSLVLLVDGNLL